MKKSAGASKKPSVDSDARMLEKYKHHTAQADKHRAHADLIEAKLRTQGKHLDKWGDGMGVPSVATPKIVKKGKK
jgi:hypothetical protein